MHQQYLKRKANGKHKTYMDSVKDKYKAEIDERKAVLRAEDIARGVFVPVSNLPKQEPKKGMVNA